MRRGKRSRQPPPPSRQPTARPVVRRGCTPQDSSSAEVFDLGDPNSNDSGEESGVCTMLIRPHSPASIEPTIGSESVPTRPASPVLLAPPPVKTSHKAYDVWHFFHKVNGVSTICTFCRYVTTFLWTRYLLTRYSELGSVRNQRQNTHFRQKLRILRYEFTWTMNTMRNTFRFVQRTAGKINFRRARNLLKGVRTRSRC